MGDFDEIKITKDDEKARRLATLSLILANSKTPLTSSEIKKELYPELSVDTFTRTFSRDREDMESMGFKFIKSKGTGDEASWTIDAEASLKGGAALSPEEAVVLNLACQPLVNDPGFLYSNELRFALTKIDQQFSNIEKAVKGSAATATRVSETLRDCLETRHPAKVTYTNSKGVTSTRILAPYGFYTVRRAAYMAAAIMWDSDEGEGRGDISGTMTYKLSRITEAKKVAKLSYQVPDDFDVTAHERLAFQIGPTVGQARFFVPAFQEREMRANANNKGSWELADGDLEWSVDMSDPTAAASCAIAWAIKPLAPKELVETWEKLLKGAINNG